MPMFTMMLYLGFLIATYTPGNVTPPDGQTISGLMHTNEDWGSRKVPAPVTVPPNNP